VSDEDIEELLVEVTNHGCPYVAVTNIVFEYYKGRESEFEETFGYPMYVINESGQIDYNFEYLTLELFLYMNGNVRNWSYIDGAWASYYDEDGNLYSEEVQLMQYLHRKYGVGKGVTCSLIGIQNNEGYYEYPTCGEGLMALTSKVIQEVQNGNTILFRGCGFDLYSEDSNSTNENVGGHDMIITGYDEERESFIVSTWGEKMYMPVSSFPQTLENGFVQFLDLDIVSEWAGSY